VFRWSHDWNLSEPLGIISRTCTAYKFIWLNRLIDVASEEPPELRVISEEPGIRDSVQ